MSARLRDLLTLGAALGSGVNAGVFFAFSAFVMPALSRVAPERGIAAMQSINVAAVGRWFMAAFLGTGAACALLTLSSLALWSDRGAGLRLGGGVLYLAGAILVTAVFNVPRNDALASLPPESAGAADLWPRYVREWTRWNHVRTAASLAAAVLFTVALGAGRATSR